ncbi:MAG: hypothetical protein ACI8PQ_002736 [Planctomycetota bacterium]|jgi:hypothetical protein
MSAGNETPQGDQRLRLADLPLLAKIGVTSLVAVIAIGMAASLAHVENHHENRDGEEGLSRVDIDAAYHGIDQPSLLLRSLENDHAEELSTADRQLLIGWLKGTRVSQDYDSLELGDLAPAEVIDGSCLSCHSRNADPSVQPMLDYWDDVESIAFSRQLDATPKEILLMSMHTHALSLGVLCLVFGLLCLASRFSTTLRSLPLGIGGPALLLDFAGWWMARESGVWVLAILVGGGLFALSTALSCLLIVAEMWIPRRAA